MITGLLPDCTNPVGIEHLVLVFDVPLLGFARWAKKRLELLGFKVVEPPYKDDDLIAKWAKENFGNFIIITTDKNFPCKHKIVLPTFFKTNAGVGKPKYEKLYTRLCVAVHRFLSAEHA